MNYTPNLNLKKPAKTDPVLIDDLNDNMDILDQEVSALETLFADSRIVEQGSNDDGYWVHFAQGLQIAWQRSPALVGNKEFDIAVGETTQWFTAPRPAPFTGVPACYFGGSIADVSGNPVASSIQRRGNYDYRFKNEGGGAGNARLRQIQYIFVGRRTT